MKSYLKIILVLLLLIPLYACRNEFEEPLTVSGRLFKQLWQEINDNHATLYKQPCSWNNVYKTYLPKSEGINNIDTFAVNIVKPLLEDLQDVQTEVIANGSRYFYNPIKSSDKSFFYSEWNDFTYKSHSNSYYEMHPSIMPFVFVSGIYMNMLSQPRFENYGGRNYLYVRYGGIPAVYYNTIDDYIRQYLDSLPLGIIVDCRHRSKLELQQLSILLSYFLREGHHEVCRAIDSKYSLVGSQEIEGNGRFDNLPIAVIIDGSTSYDANTFIYIVATYNDIGIIGYRPTAQGGCLITSKEFSQGDLSLTLSYPITRLGNDSFPDFSEPIYPQKIAYPYSFGEVTVMREANVFYDDHIWQSILWIDKYRQEHKY